MEWVPESLKPMLALWPWAVGLSVLALVVWSLSYTPPALQWNTGVAESAATKTYPCYKIPRKVLVTGGTGFVGRHLVEALQGSGCDVTIFDIRKQDVPGAKVIQGDLQNPADVESAVSGMDVVFHVASPPDNSPRGLLEAVNVRGTSTLVEACVSAGVKGLVLTSSASIVYEGVDQDGVDETVRTPRTFRDAYAETKALGEEIVLSAGRSEGGGKPRLPTVAIRPHQIYGDRDPLFWPTLMKQTAAGRGKFVIGSGANVVDFTYVKNVIHGHCLAAEKLLEGVEGVSGEAFFVSDDCPLPFWTQIGRIQLAFGYPPAWIRLPYSLLWSIATLVHLLLSLYSTLTSSPAPRLTFAPHRLTITATGHWYSIEKAKRLLGYTAHWNYEEALWCAVNHFRQSFSNPKTAADPSSLPPDRRSAIPPRFDKITKSMLAEHKDPEDAWLMVGNRVYDVTKFVDDHPGGEEALMAHTGKDATEAFRGIQHGENVKDMIEQYLIGAMVDDDGEWIPQF